MYSCRSIRSRSLLVATGALAALFSAVSCAQMGGGRGQYGGYGGMRQGNGGMGGGYGRARQGNGGVGGGYYRGGNNPGRGYGQGNYQQAQPSAPTGAHGRGYMPGYSQGDHAPNGAPSDYGAGQAYGRPHSSQDYGGQTSGGQNFGGQYAGGGNYPQNVRPGAGAGSPGVNGRGEHLSQWMQQHGTMSPHDQQRALQNEPGFHQLPQGTQQRMLDRLNRLNSMPQQQRDRVISRGEAMERMTPDQRGQVRGAMGQLGALPEDRRRAVARSFRELRNMPVPERNAMLNSPQYHQQFSDEERGTLGNLLSVSPLLPPGR